jgi:hypothetical protein
VKSGIYEGWCRGDKRAENMETINRIAVTISFKEKFLEWVNQLPDNDVTWTMGMLNEDKSVYLVPEFDSNEEAAEWFGPHKTTVLEEAFESISTDEKQWPKKSVFEEYLTAEFHSMVWDLVDDEPIDKEFL